MAQRSTAPHNCRCLAQSRAGSILEMWSARACRKPPWLYRNSPSPKTVLEMAWVLISLRCVSAKCPTACSKSVAVSQKSHSPQATQLIYTERVQCSDTWSGMVHLQLPPPLALAEPLYSSSNSESQPGSTARMDESQSPDGCVGSNIVKQCQRLESDRCIIVTSMLCQGFKRNQSSFQ